MIEFGMTLLISIAAGLGIAFAFVVLDAWVERHVRGWL